MHRSRACDGLPLDPSVGRGAESDAGMPLGCGAAIQTGSVRGDHSSGPRPTAVNRTTSQRIATVAETASSVSTSTMLSGTVAATFATGLTFASGRPGRTAAMLIVGLRDEGVGVVAVTHDDVFVEAVADRRLELGTSRGAPAEHGDRR